MLNREDGPTNFERHLESLKQASNSEDPEVIAKKLINTGFEQNYDGYTILSLIAGAMGSAMRLDSRLERNFGRAAVNHINQAFHDTPSIIKYILPTDGTEKDSFDNLHNLNQWIELALREEERGGRARRRILSPRAADFIQQYNTLTHSNNFDISKTHYLFYSPTIPNGISTERILAQNEVHSRIMLTIDDPEGEYNKPLRQLNTPARMYRLAREADNFRVQGAPSLLTNFYGGATYETITQVAQEDQFDQSQFFAALSYASNIPPGNVLYLRFTEGAFLQYTARVEDEEMSAEELKIARFTDHFLQWLTSNLLAPSYAPSRLNQEFDTKLNNLLIKIDGNAKNTLLNSISKALFNALYLRNNDLERELHGESSQQNPLVQDLIANIPPELQKRFLDDDEYKRLKVYFHSYLARHDTFMMDNLVTRIADPAFLSMLSEMFTYSGNNEDKLKPSKSKASTLRVGEKSHSSIGQIPTQKANKIFNDIFGN